MVSRRIIITRPEINGKRLGSLHLRNSYGINISRIYRSGMALLATPDLMLQVGDCVVVVGGERAIMKVEKVLGNAEGELNEPNLTAIYIGLALGLVLGAIPISIPGIALPVKLGLAGGPIVVGILMGIYGPRFHLVTYTTQSANLMLREIGLALFLASVGIKAGGNFISTVVEGDGLLYVLCGFLITVIPILCIGPVARYRYKMNYFTLMGMIAGTYTDPPALAYANQTAGNDAPALGYTTVYPLAMFLRIITAQVLILILG